MPRRPAANRHDVLIAGGGPVGLTLALALAKRGFATAVADPAGRGADNRAYFVSYGCWRIFRALGIEDALAGHAELVLSVEAEGAGGGIEFLAEECEATSELGRVIEAGPLDAALKAAADAAGVVRIGEKIHEIAFGDPDVAAQVGPDEVRASLIVGCDGARSMVRRQAGLRFEGHDYPAKAVSADLKLARPHEGAARQVFLSGGPLAVLPLTRGRGSLVWTVRAEVADALMAMTEKEFEAELAKQAGDFLTDAKLGGPRIAFPMGVKVAEAFHAPRVALAGDSAHVVHPLAGQGLNLGLKDVAALVDVIADAAHVGLDIGSEAALAPYTRWRRADVVATAGAMEGFVRGFGAPAPVRAVAGIAMRLAGESRAARKLFAREAGGDLGELPTLMRAG